MQKLYSSQEIKNLSLKWQHSSQKVGFVPTMGNLHEGHLSLIKEAKRQCDQVVVSVFVNPVQFGPNEDFKEYPRNQASDIKLCQQTGVDFLWFPKEDQIYPNGFSTYAQEEDLSRFLCGKSRQDHFRGVCTVLVVLFNLVRPHKVFLGQKDAQQTLIVKRMIKDWHLPLEAIVCPLVRESDGLAMSSRNANLSREQRAQSTVIYQSLKAAAKLILQGKTDASRIAGEINHILTKKRLLRVIYIEIISKKTLKPLRNIETGNTLIAIAVWLGSVRLIDNIEV